MIVLSEERKKEIEENLKQKIKKDWHKYLYYISVKDILLLILKHNISPLWNIQELFECRFQISEDLRKIIFNNSIKHEFHKEIKKEEENL